LLKRLNKSDLSAISKILHNDEKRTQQQMQTAACLLPNISGSVLACVWKRNKVLSEQGD